ncbi:MAG TPA: response regulator [Verrucomicrobiae bacterium]|jgi:DNA-binding NarL/FixJ family response regulator|nr:response regulator [Verrucomicrobiae bacterium]
MENAVPVLLIEDDPGDVRLVRQQLAASKDTHFEVVEKGLLSEGLERLAQGDIRVVLLDLSLPDGRGLQAVTRVHEASPATPIIAMNVVENGTLALQAVQEGAQDFFVKAAGSSASLPLVIRLAMERKKVERELARLASFAWKNPNAIFESSFQGKVLYLNPAGRHAFPELLEKSDHPFLSGLPALIEALQKDRKDVAVRELELGESIYEQHVWYIPEARVIHSTLVDVTERKRAVEALKRRTVEVERMNRVMIGREIKMKELKEQVRRLESQGPQGKEAA